MRGATDWDGTIGDPMLLGTSLTAAAFRVRSRSAAADLSLSNPSQDPSHSPSNRPHRQPMTSMGKDPTVTILNIRMLPYDERLAKENTLGSTRCFESRPLYQNDTLVQSEVIQSKKPTVRCTITRGS
jgi:hypothetical protein